MPGASILKALSSLAVLAVGAALCCACASEATVISATAPSAARRNRVNAGTRMSNDTPRTSGVKPESRQPQVRLSTVRSAGGGGRPGRPPAPSTRGQLLAEGNVIHAEGRWKRPVRRGAELHPHGLSPERREAESPLRVDDACRLGEIGQRGQRGGGSAR